MLTGNLDVQSTNTATAGNVFGAKITPTYNQVTATTANTDLLINRTQTAVGSGQQNLIDAQVGGVSRFRVANTGAVTATSFSGDGSGLTGVAAGALALSSLTAATATTTIDNLSFAQAWNFSTATTQSPLSISANALTTGSLLNLTTSNATVNSTNGLLNVANTGASTTGVVARIQSNSTAGSGMTVLANGNVGIGTAAPSTKLEVNGAIRTPTISIPAGTTTIDMSASNFFQVAFTGNTCTALTLNNLLDGQSYTITTNGVTSGTCSFAATGLTFKYAPANASVTADTVYTLIRTANTVYVSWITGFF